MSTEEIRREIACVLREKLGIEQEISAETSLLGQLKLESMEQLTLVVELENHFRVAFDPGDEEGIETVGQLVQLIERLLANEDEADDRLVG